MPKFSHKSIFNSLKPLFKNCFETGLFEDQWKKANIVPTQTYDNKQLVKNYRTIYLLPNCGKLFERFIFNNLFEYFTENNLFTPHQSGFIPGDLCV